MGDGRREGRATERELRLRGRGISCSKHKRTVCETHARTPTRRAARSLIARGPSSQPVAASSKPCGKAPLQGSVQSGTAHAQVCTHTSGTDAVVASGAVCARLLRDDQLLLLACLYLACLSAAIASSSVASAESKAGRLALETMRPLISSPARAWCRAFCTVPVSVSDTAEAFEGEVSTGFTDLTPELFASTPDSSLTRAGLAAAFKLPASTCASAARRGGVEDIWCMIEPSGSSDMANPRSKEQTRGSALPSRHE